MTSSLSMKEVNARSEPKQAPSDTFLTTMSALHELIIQVRYCDGGTKATKSFSMDSPESVIQLNQDLEQLKFPAPRQSNVSFVSAGCMRASWICSLHSPLYKRIKTLVYRTKSPSFTQFWGSSTPANLEIAWITLTEKPVEDPNILPDSDTITPVHSSPGSDNEMRLKRAHTIDARPRNAATAHQPGVMPLPATDENRPAPVVYDWIPDSSKDPPLPRNQSVTSQTRRGSARVPIAQPSRRTRVDSRAPSRSSSREKDVYVLQEDMSDEHLPLFLCQRSERFEEPLPDETKTRDFERQLADERAARGKLEVTCNRAQRALDTSRAKLAGVDDELVRERERCANLEVELASERRKRQEAENVLTDVERECRAPFVVPAILDAFCMISKITNWTMDVDHRINGGS